MYKKKYASKRRYGIKKRRSYRRKTLAAKVGRSMQRKSLSFVKKKYTFVTPIQFDDASNATGLTISHIGGINTNAPVASTLTLGDANPDNIASTDMKAYQFFRITGVGFKIFWPEGTDLNNTPVQWSMGYSSNQIIKPNVDFSRLQSLATYQTSSCDSSKPVSRYFKTRQSLARLGIEWCNTDEYKNFKPATVLQATALYGNQLPINQGSSTNLKFYRAQGATGAG